MYILNPDLEILTEKLGNRGSCTGCKVQVAGYKIRVARYGLQGAGTRYRYNGIKDVN